MYLHDTAAAQTSEQINSSYFMLKKYICTCFEKRLLQDSNLLVFQILALMIITVASIFIHVKTFNSDLFYVQ